MRNRLRRGLHGPYGNLGALARFLGASASERDHPEIGGNRYTYYADMGLQTRMLIRLSPLYNNAQQVGMKAALCSMLAHALNNLGEVGCLCEICRRCGIYDLVASDDRQVVFCGGRVPGTCHDPEVFLPIGPRSDRARARCNQTGNTIDM